MILPLTKDRPIIAGVDPGAGGALFLVNVLTWEFELHDIPTYIEVVGKTNRKRINCDLLSDIVIARPIGLICTEKVHAMPQMDVKGIFSFGRAYGQLEMLAAAAGIQRDEYDPAVWKRQMQINSDKDLSRQRAGQLIPALAPYLTRKTDHDRAEAGLLALFALLKLGIMPGPMFISEKAGVPHLLNQPKPPRKKPAAKGNKKH